MFYENELDFLRQTFKKRRVRVLTLKSEDIEAAKAEKDAQKEADKAAKDAK